MSALSTRSGRRTARSLWTRPAEPSILASMGDEIPHESIREAQDRSWTSRVLARLAAPGLDDDERRDVAFTLERLEDPRSEAPLGRLLADRALPGATREIAGAILRGMGAVDRAAIRAMAREGDRIEQRHAVLASDHGEVDLVEPIAKDPGSPLHRDAIIAMEWGFEEPRFVAMKIAALAHADPGVREAAADVLAWDEPIAAEEALIRAASDPVDAVAAAAAGTLRYYRTRRAVASLASLRARGGLVGEQAGESFDEIRSWFQTAVQQASRAGREALIAWMRPSWDALAFSDDELGPEPAVSGPPAALERARTTVAADALIRELSEPDGAWATKIRLLHDADPAAFSREERTRLARFLVEHVDPAVRGEAGHLLAAWDDHASLLRLAGDARFLVVKHAMYHLARTSPSAAAAACALDHLDGARVTSTHAYETLLAYVAHAPPAASIPELVRRVVEDPRELCRIHGASELARLGAKAEVEALLLLLSAPPTLTWGAHIALLDAARRLGLTPRARDLDGLRDADDLDVQRALLG